MAFLPESTIEQALQILWQAVISLCSSGFIIFFYREWITSKFDKKNTQFKSTIEHEFKLLLNRQTKWHDKENEVLSNAWSKLIDSRELLNALILNLKFTTNFDKLTNEDFKMKLDQQCLPENEKEYLMKIPKEERDVAYSKIMDQKWTTQAFEACKEFCNYFNRNKIFIEPTIKYKFKKAQELISKIFITHNYDHNRISNFQPSKALHSTLYPLIEEIEEVIQNQLYPQTIEEKP
jgi:hypothetical protein